MFSQKNYPISIRLPPLRFMKSQRWEATSLQAVWKDGRCFWRHFSWRVCSRAQVCHHRIASPSSGISNSRNVYLCQWHGMFRNERTVDFIETFFLPMSSLGYDSSLCSVPELSLIFNEVISFTYTNHGYLLRDLDQPWLSSQHLEDFALAVHGKGTALENC